MNSLLVMDAILLERIGSLHLVLLHLPIGFVVAAGMLELSKWWRPSVDGTIYQRRLLAMNAVASLFTAGAGLVLASTGNYPAETLEWHRWAGLVCAGLAVAAWLAQVRGRVEVARAALAALLAATVVTGHLGATLTHGPEVANFWISARSGDPVKPVQSPGIASRADTIGVFEKEILPVLDSACIECHGPDKAKGRLRLDSRAAAFAGGRSGRPAIVPGKPEESELLRRVRLPREDDEAMPLGDDPGLSVAEIASLEKWIAAGAEWR
jgi:uncharacterized membrane protein